MRRLNDERGSALMLMPAAALILILLASIAVDFAIAFLGRRELVGLAAAAANDAATVAVSRDPLNASGAVVVDPGAAEAYVRDYIDARRATSPVENLQVVDVVVTVNDGVANVEVALAGRVAYVLATAIPGAPDGTAVSATAGAVADVVP